MFFINPKPETPPPIIKPRKDETLQSWLTRKLHATKFHDFKLRFSDWDERRKIY